MRTAVLLAAALSLSACGGARHSSTAALIDGHRFGYIRSATETSVIFDPADFLTYEYGQTVAARDGAVKKGQPLVDDYYAPNPSTATATLPVAKEPQVTIVKCDAGCRQGFRGTWAAIIRSLHSRPYPWWLTIRNGVVTAIDEQYVP